jgi:hypothetical protein
MCEAKGKGESGHLVSVTNRPRFCRYSQFPSEAYWGLLWSQSIWLPVSNVLSACYCLDRHCVLKSLVTPEYDETISSASTTKISAYLSAVRNMTERSSC